MQLVLIGYPCKSISSQNNSPASFLDGKSLTGLGYRSLLSFVDYSRPEIVIGENVRSLASRRRQFKDEVPIDIQNRAFAGRGYNQWNKVVTSSDFGLAQSRTRCWVMYLKFFKDKLLKGNSGNFVWEHCVGQMLPMFGRSVFSLVACIVGPGLAMVRAFQTVSTSPSARVSSEGKGPFGRSAY